MNKIVFLISFIVYIPVLDGAKIKYCFSINELNTLCGAQVTVRRLCSDCNDLLDSALIAVNLLYLL